ncbi:MAG: galactokinase [Minisyncoccia bacterium]
MLMSRTPFRISLGGGGTDLPSYCEKYGGFIFGVAINMFMDIFARRPWIGVSEKIELQYLKFESVDIVDEVEHTIGREALKLAGVKKAVSIYFHADTPMGTGLGSSGSCAVGLLNVLWNFKGVQKSQTDLAEGAFRITQALGLPDGKQDPYLAALGGFTVLEIGTDQSVRWYHPNISPGTVRQFVSCSLLFYTGVRRESVEVLRDQDRQKALKLKHRTKVIGRQVLKAFERGNIFDFGCLMDEHWRIKREMSDRISSPEFDVIYNSALENGALGGKLIGAGGGGYFLFCCADQEGVLRLKETMVDLGFKPIDFGIDYKGTRVARIDF